VQRRGGVFDRLTSDRRGEQQQFGGRFGRGRGRGGGGRGGFEEGEPRWVLPAPGARAHKGAGHWLYARYSAQSSCVGSAAIKLRFEAAGACERSLREGYTSTPWALPLW
jgi:hypothetical protein